MSRERGEYPDEPEGLRVWRSLGLRKDQVQMIDLIARHDSLGPSAAARMLIDLGLAEIDRESRARRARELGESGARNGQGAEGTEEGVAAIAGRGDLRAGLPGTCGEGD